MNSGFHLLKDLPRGERFHSGLLSTYCLDFAFLEQRAIPALRMRGIRNIAVMADARAVEEAIAASPENIRRATSLYTVSTFACPGTFHPKLHFYCGDESVMLLLGSGNLTAGGCGKNSETFVALYADAKEQSQLPLLYSAWDYLKRACGEFHGVAAKQLRWMEEHCSLLHSKLDGSTPANHGDWTVMPDGLAARFLTSETRGLLAQLQDAIPNPRGIETITIASPYFDEKGALLHELLDYFRAARIRVLVQPDAGVLPHKMKAHVRLSFHQWSASTAAKEHAFGEQRTRFLHAKLFHFAGRAENYLMVGSANATAQAFAPASRANKEAVLLLRREEPSWAKELGIAAVGPAVPMDDLQAAVRRRQPTGKPTHRPYRISAVDAMTSHYTLNLDTALPAEAIVHAAFLDRTGSVVHITERLQTTRSLLMIEVPTTCIQAAVLMRLQSTDGMVVSNTQVITDERAIWSTNPDPKNRRLQHILDRMAGGEYNELDLYDCWQVFWEEGEAGPSRRTNHPASTSADDAQAPALSIEEVRELMSHGSARSDHSTDASERALDAYLDSIARGADATAQEDADDEEDGNISRGRKRKEKSPSPSVIVDEIGLAKQREKIARFYRRYVDRLMAAEPGAYQVGRRDYAFFLLALSHLMKLAGEQVQVRKNVRDEAEQPHHEPRIPMTGPVHTYSSVSSTALNVTGKFLRFLKASGGDEVPEGPYATEQLSKFKSLCLGEIFNAIALLSSHASITADVETENRWMRLLLLNGIDVFQTAGVDVEERMRLSATRLRPQSSTAQSDFRVLYKHALAQYTKIQSLRSGEYSAADRIHYSGELGYSYIQQFLPTNAPRPKAVKVVTPAAVFAVNEFLYDKVYNFDKHAWYALSSGGSS